MNIRTAPEAGEIIHGDRRIVRAACPHDCPDVEHFAESRLIIIWGSNSIASNLHFWSFAQQAKRNGAKLVLVEVEAGAAV